jgi:hypothetical protein
LIIPRVDHAYRFLLLWLVHLFFSSFLFIHLFFALFFLFLLLFMLVVELLFAILVFSVLDGCFLV